MIYSCTPRKTVTFGTKYSTQERVAQLRLKSALGGTCLEISFEINVLGGSHSKEARYSCRIWIQGMLDIFSNSLLGSLVPLSGFTF